MEPSIFTKIIRGEIPSHKVYEDDKNFAFLDIHPAVPGHTLVVPKVQIANLHELNPEDYSSLMLAVRKVMKRMAEVFGSDYKICLKVMGFDVPHTHVHVIACRNAEDFRAVENMGETPNHTALAKVAAKLKI